MADSSPFDEEKAGNSIIDDQKLAAGSGKLQKKKEGSSSVSIFKLFHFADGVDYFLIFVGVVGSVVHGASMPAFFFFFGQLINSFGTHQQEDTASIIGLANSVNKYSLYLVYLGLVLFASTWAEVACWMHAGERQASKMRIKYLESILAQDISFFDTDMRTGALLYSLASDTILFQEAIGEKMGNFIHYLATFIAGFAVGFSSVWKIALVTLAVVPAIAFAGGIYAYIITQISLKTQKAYGEAGAIAEQAIAQVRTVYSFVGEKKAMEAYSNSLKVTLSLGYKAGLGKGFGVGFTYSILFCSWALILWYAGTLIRLGLATGGKAIAATFSVIVGGLALGQSMNTLSTFGKGRSAGHRIFELIDEVGKVKKSLTKFPSKETTLVDVRGDIELQDVKFTYPSRPDVLIFKGLTLKIPSGATVAIVGASGSGKSTIISLIERFYDPISGKVLLDGVDIRTMNIFWLRDQISLVSQEPALFGSSIIENIRYGKPDASVKDVEAAGRLANAHTFVNDLPDGYNTQVGERGVQLSGGQKQRVAIARAILKNPKILLLDEATSALDATSEHVVQDALDRVMVGRSTVVVAHRLSTIRNVDTIAVIQGGVVVEQGGHEELLAKGEIEGAYASLVKLQEMGQSKPISMTTQARQSSVRGSSAFNQARLSHQKSTSSTRIIESDLKAGELTKMKASNGRSLYWRLVKMNRPEWPYVALGSVGAILAGCMNPVFAVVISNVLKVYYYSDYEKMKMEITKYSFVLLGLAATIPAIFFSQHYYFGIVGENLTNRIRELMFKSMLRNEVGWFDEEENGSARLASRLATTATNVRAAVGDRLSILVQNIALFIASCVVSLVGCWQMALVMIATLPLLIGSALAEQVGMKGFAGDLEAAHARAGSMAVEAVGNMRTVVAFNAQKRVVEMVRAELKAPGRASLGRGHVAGCLYGAAQLLTFCSYALALWYGSVLVKEGRAEFGSVIRVFMVLLITAMAVAEALSLSPDILKAGQALSAVFAVIDRQTLIDPDDAAAQPVVRISGEVELRHVDFAYPSRPGVAVFSDLCLLVAAGKSLALVGASGSGKSSVIALIERFYDPSSGAVTIDGVDIRLLNLRSLRRHIGLVQQEPALFACSIYDNILYGREGASRAEVEAAATAANAHAFISALPHGYDTQVGERGAQLSGGQKQRVAIARAMIKEPSILLLDEATSALDAEAEAAVQDAVDRMMERRTTVVVAHRLSTIQKATTIAVLQDGHLIEQGSHSSLLSNPNSAYAHLINLQQRGPTTGVDIPPSLLTSS